MCGISAIFNYRPDGTGDPSSELARMHETLRSRGPDGEATWRSSDGAMFMAHRRLAIIDLDESGAQPMHDNSGELTIIFNGEIYNYRQLRSELEQEGAVFRTSSDTEVLLELMRLHGPEAIPRLRGMFAFAIYDRRDRSMLLARDAYGIKPLYYADDGRSIRLASQLRALIASGAVERQIDPAAACGYFLWGSIPEPLTMIRGARQLPAGCWMKVDRNGAGHPVQWIRLKDAFRDAESTARTFTQSEAEAEIRDALGDSVRHHLVADVPVAAFLSAGIDSGAIVGLASEGATSPLRTVTVRFPEYAGTANDEAPLARAVAAFYGAVNEVLDVPPSVFEEESEAFFQAMDQPTIDGANSYFVSKAAAATGVKVALSGLGGDELFGSYPSFGSLPVLVAAAAIHRGCRSFLLSSEARCRHSAARGSWPKKAGLLDFGGSWAGAYFLRRGLFMPWELPAILGDEIVREGLGSVAPGLLGGEDIAGLRRSYGRVSVLESSLYMRNQLLRDTDWASMAHSLEVRVPFVDPHLLQRLAPVLLATGAQSKRMVGFAPRPPLPEEIRHRRKTGFKVPTDRWLPADSEEKNSRRWARHVWIKWLESAGMDAPEGTRR